MSDHQKIAREIRTSLVRYDRPVGKRLEKTSDGTLKKSSLLDARGGPGEIVNKRFATAEEAFDFHLEVDSSHMFLTGTFADDCHATKALPEYWRNRARQELEWDHAETFASLTGQYLAFREERGLVRIDIDTCKASAVFPEAPTEFATAEDVRAAMLDILPEAAETPMLVRLSSSSLIVDQESGELLSGAGGWRVLMPIADARETPRILQLIHDRCWAQKVGAFAYVDKGGAVQIRSLADLALARPTQPDYPCAELGKGLSYQEGAAAMFALEGPDLDLRTVQLGQDEARIANNNIQEAKLALKDKARDVKDARKTAHAQLLQQRGVCAPSARKLAEARYERNMLVGSDVVDFEGARPVSVADLLGARGQDLDNQSCCDPIEPDYDDGRLVGRFYWNDGEHPGVFSFARGGRFVELRYDLESAKNAISAANTDTQEIVRILALLDADALETNLALKAAASALGLGNKTKDLKDAMTDYRRTHRITAPHSNHFDASAVPEQGGFSRNTPLSPETFPYVKSAADGSLKPIDHIENIEHLLDRYGFMFRYNQILKEIEWSHPDLDSSGDNADEQLYAELLSLCSLNGVPSRSLTPHITAIADRRAYNPVTDYLHGLSWDGTNRFDRVSEFFETEDHDILLIAMRIFLLQACAAADHACEARKQNSGYAPSFESVITLVGKQGLGKTKGFRRLLPEPLRLYYKEGVELNPHNKDSVKKAVSSWIVELGELDGTFRKADIAALKAHLSNSIDELRMPYARTVSKFQRRTAYVGTVNEEQFLADSTGNRRFLPIQSGPIKVNWGPDELDQLWAEAWTRYRQGEQWWPTAEEDALLSSHTERYRSRDWIEETIAASFDWAAEIEVEPDRKTATVLFQELQSKSGSVGPRPTQKDLKDVGEAMKRFWSNHQQVISQGGNLYLSVRGEKWSVHNRGGKANGWLIPPIKLARPAAEVLSRIPARKKAS